MVKYYSFIYLFLLFHCILNKEESSDMPMNLIAGEQIKKNLTIGEKHYYYIDSLPDKELGFRINIMFVEGFGRIFVNIANSIGNNYPDENSYDYIGKLSYSSKSRIIIIPYSDIENIETKNIKLLITIIGDSTSFSTDDIKYYLSFAKGIENIQMNKKYNYFITKGETQYFQVKANSNTKRLYISMSNKEGNGDIYVNYGNEFPTEDKYNWKSSGVNNEFLDISKEDSFFSSQGLNDLQGFYLIMVKGYDDTLYDLYISDKDIKLTYLSEGYPGGCECKNQDDSCYFLYENINSNYISETYDKEIIFFIEYTYGSGEIFGKLYEKGDLDTIMMDLPANNNFDFTNEKRQNYVRMKLSKEQTKYTLDSVIMVNVKCFEKSLFDLNVLPLRTNEEINNRYWSKMEYIYTEKDNLYYLKSGPNSTTIFYYYYFKNNDLNYQLRAYSGSADVVVYLNDSIYNYETKNYTFNYRELNKFTIDENGENQYSSSIEKNDGLYHYIYFKVYPKRNCVFFIHLNFDEDFTKVPISKLSTYIMKNDYFYGYFDFLIDYDEVILTIINESQNKLIRGYIKINIVDKLSTNINDTYTYSLPSDGNYDFTDVSSEILNQISFKIQNPLKQINETKKYARILFKIEIDNYYYYNSRDETIYIMITPNVNNYKRIKTEQNMYYFYSVSSDGKDKTVFNLIKKNKNDDLIVIDISSCNGNFDYSVSNKLTSSQELSKYDKMDSKITELNGKKIITIPNTENFDYYLSVWGVDEGNLKNALENNDTNVKDINFTLYYYSTTKEKYKYISGKSLLYYENLGKGKIKIKIPQKYLLDLKLQNNLKNYTYTFLLTDKENEFKLFESTCFLSEKYKELKNNAFYKNLKIKYNFDNIEVSGLENKKNYYMNVLLTNIETGEIFTFQPEQIYILNPSKSPIIYILFVLIIIALFVLFFFYYKYNEKKTVLKYEKEDIRNMGALPINELEMTEANKRKQKSKYESLTEEPVEI